MKISELTVNDLADYLKCDDEPAELSMFLDAAKSYVKGYTGQTIEALDAFDEPAIAVLTVAADLYDNRNMQVGIQNSYINKTLQSLLCMHSVNLLPSC